MKSVLVKITPEYQFFSDGRIWSEYYQRFLDGWDDDGYNRVTINGEDVRRHQVIASVFMKNPENKPELHHINGNRQDNRLSNLMYVTRSEHMLIHAEEWGIPVYQYTLDGEFVKEWKSIMDAERKYGNIRRCLKGEVKTAYNYQWSFEKHKRMPSVKARYERVAEKLSVQIEMCTMDWEHEAYFNGINEASRKTEIAAASICKNCKGKLKSAGGHRFKYINKEPDSGANGL